MKFILILFSVLLFVPIVSAAPYIVAFNSNQLTPSGSSISSNGITTAAGGNVLIAIGTDNCATNGGCGTETISDTANNVWTLRTQINGKNQAKSLFEYYAVSNSALSNDVVTFSSGSCECGLMVLVIGGANTISPFDGNSALPGTNTLTSSQATSISNTINTNNANDLVLAIGVEEGTSTVSMSPSMTKLFQDNTWNGQFGFDVVESSAITSTTFTASWSTAAYASLIVDALHPASNAVPSLTVSISPASNSIADVNQYESFNGVISGGTSPYYATLFVSNTANSGNIVYTSANTQFTGTAWSFNGIQITGNWATNSPLEANVVVVDSNSMEASSAYSSSFTVNPALGTPSISPNSPATNTIDAGEVLTLSSAWSGGTSTYTANWIVVNSVTHVLLTNALYSSISGTSNSFSNTIPAAWVGNTIEGNVMITDSASTPSSQSSAESTIITVDPGLVAGAITPSAPSIDNGQTITLTANPTGGSGTYTYAWYSNTGGHPSCNAANVIAGATSSTYAASPSSTTYYTYQVTDTGLLPESICSASDTVSVNAALGSASLSPGSASIDSGQSETLSASWTGGTPPYTATYYSNSLSPCSSSDTEVASYSGISGTTNTLVVTPLAANTYCFEVTDSAAGTPAQSSSSGTTSITVNPALALSSFTVSPTAPNTLANGEIWTLSASWSGGTPNYAANYIITNTITGSVVASQLYTSLSATSNSFAWTIPVAAIGNTVQANVIITDSSAAGAATVNSVKSGTITIVAAATYLTLKNWQVLGTTQPVTVATGGTPDYITLNIIAPQAGINSPGIMVANSMNGIIDYTLGYPYNAFLGSYSFNAYDTATKVSAMNTVTLYADPYFQNTTNTIEYPNNVYPFNGFTYYPDKFWANQTSSNIVGSNTVTFNFNYTIQPAVVDNPASYNNVYNRVIYTQNTVLTGNVTAFDIEINTGQTLSTNGHWLLAFNAIINNGAIFTNSLGNGAQTSLTNGGSVPNSFGGSGGGAGFGGNPGSICNAVAGNPGGNTIAPAGSGATSYGNSGGAGSSPALPSSVTNANIITWAGNFLNFFAGAGGGSDYATPGGSGANPIYMQANYIHAGTINAFGMNGANGGGSPCTINGGGAGGGGGGVIVIAYNSVYTIGTYNTLGGSGGGSSGGPAGGNGGSGNVLTYHWSTQPLATSNAKAIFTVYTGVNSYAYVPPANQALGRYYYQTKEIQLSNSLVFNATITTNMTDFKGQLTFNSPIIQYFPNAAYFPYGANTFSNRPTRWSILSDAPGNQHSNFTGLNYNLEQFSNANLTFSLINNISLTYSQFSPAIIFRANLSNNPLLQTSVTQVTGCTGGFFAFGNTVPSAPCTREISNITNYDEQFKSKLIANTIIFATYGFNNYSFANTTTFDGNNMQLYIPQSNYQNPTITQATPSIVSAAASHYDAINTYCSLNLPFNQHHNFNIYSVNTNGSLYTFTVYQGYSPLPPGTFMEVLGGISQASSIAMQEFKINSNPYSVPLQNGQPYAFRFYNCTGTIYQTNFSVWGNPITLYLPTSFIVPTYAVPNLVTACGERTAPGNILQIVCNGTDTSGLTKGWVVQLTNITSILSSYLLNQSSITGRNFSYVFSPVSASAEYHVLVLADTGNALDPEYTARSWYSPQAQVYLPAVVANGWLAILMVFAAIAIGSRSPAMSTLFMALVLFLLPALNIVSIPISIVYTMIALAALGAFIMAKKYIYG